MKPHTLLSTNGCCLRLVLPVDWLYIHYTFLACIEKKGNQSTMGEYIYVRQSMRTTLTIHISIGFSVKGRVFMQWAETKFTPNRLSRYSINQNSIIMRLGCGKNAGNGF